jgi:hypothetical protein
MSTSGLILELLGLISEVYPLISIQINLLLLWLLSLLRFINRCSRPRGATEQILLCYSSFIIGLALPLILGVTLQLDDLVIVLILLRCVVILIIAIIIILGVAAIERVFFIFLIIIVPAIILRVVLAAPLVIVSALIGNTIYRKVIRVVSKRSYWA